MAAGARGGKIRMKIRWNREAERGLEVTVAHDKFAVKTARGRETLGKRWMSLWMSQAALACRAIAFAETSYIEDL